MSSEMLQPDGLGQSPGFYTATLPRSVVSFLFHVTQRSAANPLLTVRDRLFDFTKLPLEILIILLGQMAAEQLPLFRSLCRTFRNIVTASESAIVTAALKNDRYRTASKLHYRHIYYPRPPPNILHLADLYRVACRCDSARNLALLLAQKHIIGLIRASNNTGIAPNQACSITRIADNVYPYIIGLFHFLENYRFALATFVPDPTYAYSYTIFARRPSSQIERQLLAQYNKETIYRLCCLYHQLLKIVEKKVPRVDLPTLPGQTSAPWTSNYLEVFSFGGLQAVRDVIVKRTIKSRVKYILAHYNNTTAIKLPFFHGGRKHRKLVPLPKPILPGLDHQMRSNLCRRLPSATNLLELQNAGLWGYPLEADKVVEEGKFLGYLATHDGAEPKLLL